MNPRRHPGDTTERRLSDPSASRAVLIEAHAFTRSDARDRGRRKHLEDRPSVEVGCQRLAELLKDPTIWGLPDEHCVVVPQPTRDSMLAAVDRAAAAATDTLVVYYAGHGLLYPLSNDLHLAVPETTKDKSYTAVKYEDLREILLNATRVRRKIVILDCCFSGTALRRALSSDDAAIRLAGVEGTSVLAASHATKQALAPHGEDYPAFTGELITVLAAGDPGKPELLSMADVFDRVDQALLHKGRPRPQQLNRDKGAHICIARNRAARPEPSPEDDARRGDDSNHDGDAGAVQRSDDGATERLEELPPQLARATEPSRRIKDRDITGAPKSDRRGRNVWVLIGALLATFAVTIGAMSLGGDDDQNPGRNDADAAGSERPDGSGKSDSDTSKSPDPTESTSATPPEKEREKSLVNVHALEEGQFGDDLETGEQQVNGKHYGKTVYSESCHGTGTWQLNRRYHTFKATIGLSDGSRVNSEVEYSVIVYKVTNGELSKLTKARVAVSIGETKNIKADLADGLRMKLVMKDKGEDCALNAVWIDPIIS